MKTSFELKKNLNTDNQLAEALQKIADVTVLSQARDIARDALRSDSLSRSQGYNAIINTSGEKEHTYIGDGVYASFDGYQIWLRTMRDNGLHEIALERPVHIALRDYAKHVFGQSSDN